MATNLDPKIVSAIVDSVVYRPDGGTLNDIIVALPKDTNRDDAKHWISTLVADGILRVDGTGKDKRYSATTAAAAYVTKPTADANASKRSVAACHTEVLNQVPETVPPPHTKQIVSRGETDLNEATSAAPNGGFGDAEPNSGGVHQAAAEGEDRAKNGGAATAETVASELAQIVAPIVAKLEAGAGANADMTESGKRDVSAALSQDLLMRLRALLLGTENTALSAVIWLAVMVVVTAVLKLTDTRPWLGISASAVIVGVVAAIQKARNKDAGSTGKSAPAANEKRVETTSIVSISRTKTAVETRPENNTPKSSAAAQETRHGDTSACAKSSDVATAQRTASRANPAAPDAAKDGSFDANAVAARTARGTRFRIALGALIVIAIGSVGTWYLRPLPRPPADAIRAYLVFSLAPLPVRVASLDLSYQSGGKISCEIVYRAQFAATAPLVRRIDTVQYLRAQFPSEMSAIDAANRLLGDASGARLLAAVSSSSGTRSNTNPSTVTRLDDLVLATTQTRSGATAFGWGTLTAWQQNGVWRFSGDPVRFDTPELNGELAPASAFVVDVASDSVRLKAMIADCANYAKGVLAASERTTTNVTAKPVLSATSPIQDDAANRTNNSAFNATAGTQAATTNVMESRPAESKVGDQKVIETAPESSRQNVGQKADSPTQTRTLPVPNPTQPGAYVLLANRWWPLPRNNGRTVQTKAQSVTAALSNLAQREDAFAGTTNTESDTIVAQVLFDGHDVVPIIPATNIVLAFVGPLTPISAEQLTRYPVLKTYPSIEVAPTEIASNGVRVAPLYAIAPKFIGFGPKRVAATLDESTAGVTILRCSGTLAPGNYALLCGAPKYEFAVR